mmetsp:Transcript_31304/g.99777  ORF Transcript_31304/g.99777 Transcript_31304/m.99777 type:complete len:249 (+) Transcript_31304:417-1163(+)
MYFSGLSLYLVIIFNLLSNFPHLMCSAADSAGIFTCKKEPTLSQAAHVPPMPAKPTTYMISSQSFTTGVLRHLSLMLLFMATKECSKPYFSTRPTVSSRSFFTFLMPTLPMKRCTNRGSMKRVALVRHPMRISDSASVIHCPNMTKKMHLATVFCKSATSLRSSSFGFFQSPPISLGNWFTRVLYCSKPVSRKCMWRALRIAAHSESLPVLGKKIRMFEAKRSGTQARTAPKADFRPCSERRILSQSV